MLSRGLAGVLVPALSRVVHQFRRTVRFASRLRVCSLRSGVHPGGWRHAPASLLQSTLDLFARFRLRPQSAHFIIRVS
eukprot:1779498-Alexandrium_andersonii.AAC.1